MIGFILGRSEYTVNKAGEVFALKGQSFIEPQFDIYSFPQDSKLAMVCEPAGWVDEMRGG